MKYLIIAITILSIQAQAVDLKPGLWEVETQMEQGGKKINPMAQLQDAMKNMSPEQKKQMMQAMDKSGLNVGSSGIKTCLTEEMIKDADFKVKKEGDCKSKVLKKTAKQIVTEFDCKDGTTGTSTIKIQNNKSYTGSVIMEDNKGKRGDMNFKAKFLNKDCGSVKPVGMKS